MDVIYRRWTTIFWTRLVFRPDSSSACRAWLTPIGPAMWPLANAIGTGIADDKVIYQLSCRKLSKYYLDKTRSCRMWTTYLANEDGGSKYILDNLDKLVVKAANESGGYGMLVGPNATKAQQIDEFAQTSRRPTRATISPSRRSRFPATRRFVNGPA